jgi:hypothetical protein
MNRLFAIVVVSALGACHPRAPEPEATREAVQRFFRFAEAGDCAGLQPLMASPDECENIVRQFRETHTHLVSIDGFKPDGRDAAVMLVYTTVAFGKGENHKWILRARRDGDAWKVRL